MMERQPLENLSFKVFVSVLLAIASVAFWRGTALPFSLGPDNLLVVVDPADPLKVVFDSYVVESFLEEFNPENFLMVRQFDDTALIIPRHRGKADVGNFVYVMLEEGGKASEIGRVAVLESAIPGENAFKAVESIAVWDKSGKEMVLSPITSSFYCNIDEATDFRVLSIRCLDVKFKEDSMLSRLLAIQFVKFGSLPLGLCDAANPVSLVKKIEVKGKTLVCGYVNRKSVFGGNTDRRQ